MKYFKARKSYVKRLIVKLVYRFLLMNREKNRYGIVIICEHMPLYKHGNTIMHVHCTRNSLEEHSQNCFNINGCLCLVHYYTTNR